MLEYIYKTTNLSWQLDEPCPICGGRHPKPAG